MSKTKLSVDELKLIRTSVRKAFTQLRKNGFIARGNFLCCGNCAGTAIAADATTTAHKDFGKTKAVYWHAQDDESFWKTGVLYLGYGRINSNDDKETAKVGKEIMAALESKGLSVHWEGDPSIRVAVLGVVPVLPATMPRGSGDKSPTQSGKAQSSSRPANLEWEERARLHAEKHKVMPPEYAMRLCDDGRAVIVSKADGTGYKVIREDNGRFTCSCRGFSSMGYCKHISYAKPLLSQPQPPSPQSSGSDSVTL